MSGLFVQSPDSLWWHNDGGWPPELFLTDACGELLHKLPIKNSINEDWEDITADDYGNIYIGDFGNNLNRRQNLRIYIYSPANGSLDSIRFHYPDQKAFPPAKADYNFDAEAMFWYSDSLHLFSKNILGKGNYYTKHYVLSANAGEQSAILRDSILLKKRVVTAAAISPDGQTVALLSYRFELVLGFIPWSAASIYLLRHFPERPLSAAEIFKKRAPSFLLATQFESLDFIDNESMYVASERTLFIRQKAKRVKIKKQTFKKSKRIYP